MSGGSSIALVLVVLAVAFEGISVFPRLTAFWFGLLAIFMSGFMDDVWNLGTLTKGFLQLSSG